MNKEEDNLQDAKLSALLRESRATPSLPLRFQESVWRRIEKSEEIVQKSWLEAIVIAVLRPRFALATAVVLIVAGSIVGAQEGRQTARRQAQARYLAAEAPNSLR